MTKLQWASLGERFYEAGIDRGVLYVGSAAGVSWSGLIGVTETPAATDSTSYYIDGIKHYSHYRHGEFAATIEAYTYPPQFEACEGLAYSAQGLGFDQQDRAKFGFSYRTKIGTDTKGLNHGYKIHLVYNALVVPSSRTNQTLTNTLDPLNFSWSVDTTPALVAGKSPTAHLIIDSTRTKRDTLHAIEEILYGTATTAPRLPSPTEVNDIFLEWEAFEIVFGSVSGISSLSPVSVWNDIAGDMATGKYNLVPDTRLVETPAGSGFYTFG